MAIKASDLDHLKPGQWLSDGGAKGAGSLVARRMKGGGLAFYFRYARDGERQTIALGSHKPDAKTAPALRAAQQEADKLAVMLAANKTDLKGELENAKRERRIELETAARAEEERKATAKHTLGALLDAYCDMLDARDKFSAKAVRNCFERHVKKPWPNLWKKPANDVELDDLLPVIQRLSRAGEAEDMPMPLDKPIKREANKLRSYVRAAYQAGMDARQDPDGAPALQRLKIKSNPARDLATIKGANNAKDRWLTMAEAGAYWKRIRTMKDATGAALRFHLLTGGQRLEQMARVTVKEWDKEHEFFLIDDFKGKRERGKPHKHAVPIIPAAEAAIHGMRGDESKTKGNFLFTITRGRYGVTYNPLDDRLKEVVAAMAEAGELEKGAFTLGSMRKTVETQTAAMGVTDEHRAHLQSHNLGGVQLKHYNFYKYLPEKRAALEKFYAMLTAKPRKTAKVVNIATRRPAKAKAV